MNIHLRLTNYINRFAPSQSRAEQYLKKKWIDDPEILLKDMGYDESYMCDMWIRTFVAKNCAEKDIKRKLLIKKFPHELIEQKLHEYHASIYDWDNHVSTLEQKINTLQSRGKSKMFIRMTLQWQYPYFWDEIAWLLDYKDDTSSLEQELTKYRRKYNIEDRYDRKKLYNALMQKWFVYNDIKNQLFPNQ